MSTISRSMIHASQGASMVNISDRHLLVVKAKICSLGVPSYHMPIWHTMPIMSMETQFEIFSRGVKNG